MIRIKLKSNPSTGFEWECHMNLPILEVNNEYTPDSYEDGLCGGGGIDTFTLRPLREGISHVTFCCRRPWEEETEWDVTYSVTIEVKKDMSMEITEGKRIPDVRSVKNIPE